MIPISGKDCAAAARTGGRKPNVAMDNPCLAVLHEVTLVEDTLNESFITVRIVLRRQGIKEKDLEPFLASVMVQAQVLDAESPLAVDLEKQPASQPVSQVPVIFALCLLFEESHPATRKPMDYPSSPRAWHTPGNSWNRCLVVHPTGQLH